MGEVDPAFIQEQEHRPKLAKTEAQGIPIIDLAILSSSDANPDHSQALESLVKQVGDACREWGFFQVINHGVSLEKREKIFNASRNFFAQPLEEKRQVRRDDKRPLGYYDTEHTKNVRDWKEVFDFAAQNPVTMYASYNPDDEEITQWFNQFPEYPPEMR